MDVNLAGELSPYLTMGQGGNAWEWQESAFDGLNNNPAATRATESGRWDDSEDALRASFHSGNNPNLSIISVGFRVASILEPDDNGDYNHNGTVDAADYVMWRKTDDTAAEFNAWRTHFGQPGSGSGARVNANIPEPATLVLLIFAAACRCLRRGRAV